MRVLVSGGGLGGLAAAAALTQRGIEVDLVEREASWRTNGAGGPPAGRRRGRSVAATRVSDHCPGRSVLLDQHEASRLVEATRRILLADTETYG
jgi:cation diffusion facilitator CzcD-associated flavoprotein CzcO